MATFFSHPFTRMSNQHEEPRIRVFPSDDDYADLEAQMAGDCFNSRPFLFLDMMWNLAFIVVSVFVLSATLHERPSAPLRLWICGYALQCLLHVGFVWGEYQLQTLGRDFNSGGSQDYNLFRAFSFCNSSVIKKFELINTIISSIWWVFGFYWIVMGGQPLLQDSPRLYWLSVIFLAFDVFFMIFSIVMAFFMFLLLFCCFPMLVAITYAMTVRNGASENDMRSLPRYLYTQQSSSSTFEDGNKQELLKSLSGVKTELVIQPEDSECCICLYKYVDGAELCTLPCKHHFHHDCITQWLRINATCPLCKFDILKGDTLV